ncbi:MAG: hypothetical protein WBY94_06450 [Polyangiaceae bacterium]
MCTLTFEAPTDNRYVVWVDNDEDVDAVVENEVILADLDPQGERVFIPPEDYYGSSVDSRPYAPPRARRLEDSASSIVRCS